MKKIPIKAAKEIAKLYGYDQVIIYARKVGEAPDAGEHMTTYGVNKEHCASAALQGRVLQKFMGWSVEVVPQKFELKEGKRYKSKDGQIWHCTQDKRGTGWYAPEHATHECMRLADNRIEYFYADGRYDEGGTREHCLVEEV